MAQLAKKGYSDSGLLLTLHVTNPPSPSGCFFRDALGQLHCPRRQ